MGTAGNLTKVALYMNFLPTNRRPVILAFMLALLTLLFVPLALAQERGQLTPE